MLTTLVKHSHYIQGVARREPRHRLEAYATLRRRVVALGARNSPQKAFRHIALHSGEHCSIGFQPVSGGLPTAVSQRKSFQTGLNFAPFNSRLCFIGHFGPQANDDHSPCDP